METRVPSRKMFSESVSQISRSRRRSSKVLATYLFRESKFLTQGLGRHLSPVRKVGIVVGIWTLVLIDRFRGLKYPVVVRLELSFVVRLQRCYQRYDGLRIILTFLTFIWTPKSSTYTNIPCPGFSGYTNSVKSIKRLSLNGALVVSQ
jgi:hypothetical protein